MKAIAGSRVIAESGDIIEVEGYRYFPREAVRMDLLQKVEKTAKDLQCPHGVQFYDVIVDGARHSRAAWSYEAPQPKMAKVDHWIGFWKDVEVTS